MSENRYTLTELMTVAAAREIGDGKVVFAGTGLPMLGAMLAQHTHPPECCIIASYHPGLSSAEVAKNTGFSPDVEGASETPIPTKEELHILRDLVDPERVFLN